MIPYPTDLYIASQTVREIVVVDPPYAIQSVISAIVGLVALVGGYILLAHFRVGFVRSSLAALWVLPLIIGGLFFMVSVLFGRTSHITLSADAGTLSVRTTFLSVTTASKEYPLDQVRLISVGVGDVCRFLYVKLEDKPAENLTSCTDRSGYSEVTDAMNAFLDSARGATPQGAQGISSSIP
jgi:hypothetical protein